MKEDFDQIIARLNLETAQISWPELERHFARGLLLTVSPALDLVQVGANMINNDKSLADSWLKSGELRKTGDDDAARWSEAEVSLWAVVIAPWVTGAGEKK
ncbi:MAG: DUF2288 family protein [Gammaproteobacteria bacterium]|nr:MAG: DUF2288 family protein [Gammaproteobacteria bacterium]